MNSTSSRNKPPPKHQKMKNIFGNTSQRYHSFLHPSESDESNNVSTTITSVSYVGSYNWTTDLSTTSIIVPGSPRQWNESLENSLPCNVPPDRDGNFRDTYDPRMRQTPLLPLVLAVEYWHTHLLPLYPKLCPEPELNEGVNSKPVPKFDWSSADIITNRNSLRHLLTWLQPPNKSNGGRRRPLFRIDIDLAGTKSLLFNRWDLSASEPLNATSYGFNFEKEFTKDVDDDDGSRSGRHHRMISYDFGGLKMVVRSEIDAYLHLTKSSSPSPSPTPIHLTPPLSQTNHNLTIHPSSSLLPPPPNSSLLELSTTASPKFNLKTFLSRRYPQLLLSQTPHYYLAHHHEGTFSSIRKFHLFESPELISCASAFDEKLKKLRVLLEEIQDVIKEVFEKSGNIQRTFSLIHFKEELILVKREGGKLLPDEVLALF